jgi:hypothetical protein
MLFKTKKMKKKRQAKKILIIAAILLLFLNPTYAMDFDFQPRIETGVMSYSLEQDATSISIPTDIDDASGYNIAEDEIEFSSTMPFVGGGATLFVNRLFVDLSGQYTFEGSDNVQVASSTYIEQDEDNFSSFATVVSKYDAHLDRTDHAVSVGYAVTKRFSVFAGYKWAAINLDATHEGPIGILYINNGILYGRMVGEVHTKLKYEGPFVGVAHGWQIDRIPIFEGMLSINVGLAHLNSKLSWHQNDAVHIDSLNGREIEPIDLSTTQTDEIKGRTLGLTLGLNWSGVTSIKTLSYSMGISGYRYQFDSDDSNSPNISETTVTLKLGLTYAF